MASRPRHRLRRGNGIRIIADVNAVTFGRTVQRNRAPDDTEVADTGRRA